VLRGDALQDGGGREGRRAEDDDGGGVAAARRAGRVDEGVDEEDWGAHPRCCGGGGTTITHSLVLPVGRATAASGESPATTTRGGDLLRPGPPRPRGPAPRPRQSRDGRPRPDPRRKMAAAAADVPQGRLALRAPLFAHRADAATSHTVFSVLSGANASGGGILGFFSQRHARALRATCTEACAAVAAAPWRNGHTDVMRNFDGWRASFPHVVAEKAVFVAIIAGEADAPARFFAKVSSDLDAIEASAGAARIELLTRVNGFVYNVLSRRMERRRPCITSLAVKWIPVECARAAAAAASHEAYQRRVSILQFLFRFHDRSGGYTPIAVVAEAAWRESGRA